MGHMGIQCNKLQRDELDHYTQPLQESRRDHGETGNVPTTNRFKEERAHKSSEHVNKGRRKTLTLRLVCVVRICIPTAENAGSGAGGHTMHVPGMSVAGLCARFAPTVKWHRCEGVHFGLNSLENEKHGCLFKTRLTYYIY